MSLAARKALALALVLHCIGGVGGAASFGLGSGSIRVDCDHPSDVIICGPPE